MGPHIWHSIWVLAGQLALPLATGSPVEEGIHLIPAGEWAAGLALLATLGVLFVLGSNTVRFLVIWTAAGLAPFVLWEPQNLSPRYVYFAAMPFSILIAWCVSGLIGNAAALAARLPWGRWTLQPSLIGAATVLVIGAGLVSSRTLLERNDDWSRETAKYGILREGLEAELKTVPAGTRVIILDGRWPDFWSTRVAQALYGERNIQVASIPAERIAQTPPRQNDVVMYLIGDRLRIAATVRP
jgi:hypothetical protein